MHIPDGFLQPNTWVPAWVISVTGIGLCIKKVTRTLKDKMVPLMGVMAAFVFAAQMLNFPVVGGTSGHLLGGVLAAVLLGPFAGAIVLSVVLFVQCIVFQDGGLTAFGANVFNMAIAGTMLGYVVYSIIRKIIPNKKGILIATAFAAWSSVVIASLFCALELSFSGTSPFNIIVPAMVIIHALIGIGEAIISYFVVSFVLKIRPDLIYNGGTK